MKINDSDRVGVLVDTTRCMGCRACQVACKQWNQLPAEKDSKFRGTYENPPALTADTWTKIQFHEFADSAPKWRFRKQQCYHCEDASCVNVCPTGAAKKRPNGIVVIDQSICAGCKYCVEACPFQTPKFSEEAGTAIKCRFCFDRIENGLKPACVTACATGALFFGKRSEVLAEARRRQKACAGSQIYGETELGGLGWITLVDRKAAELGLIEDPKAATRGILAKWLAGIIPGVAMLAGLGWLFKRRTELAEKSSAEPKT